MRVHAGTSGYSYKQWKGVFYPEQLPQADWLSYYASKLPSVEINNTFYRMPRTKVVESWRDSVPEGFRFVIKASRRITHQSRLSNAGEPVGYLLKSVAVLGSKLGAVLFQLPPNMRADLERLRAFQALLPERLPVAFEFRHESWRDPAVDDALSARGHARVISHDAEDPVQDMLPGPLAYLRLRAPTYADTEMAAWHDRLSAAGAEDAFVFFKHEDDGGGPQMAARFLALAPQRDLLERRAAAGRAGPQAAPRKVARRKAPAAKRAPARSGSAKRSAAAKKTS